MLFIALLRCRLIFAESFIKRPQTSESYLLSRSFILASLCHRVETFNELFALCVGKAAVKTSLFRVNAGNTGEGIEGRQVHCCEDRLEYRRLVRQDVHYCPVSIGGQITMESYLLLANLNTNGIVESASVFFSPPIDVLLDPTFGCKKG